MMEIHVERLQIGQRILGESMDFRVPSGEIHLLKGPNGCGKSLLLDVVTGLHSSSGVNVSLNGQRLHRAASFGRWQAGISRMFQTPALPGELAVEEILERFGLKDSVDAPMDKNILHLLAKGGVLRKMAFGEHSFGQQRFIELAVAVKSGQYCLLDEPFAGVGPSLVEPTMLLIREAAAVGKGILVIDHLFAEHQSLYVVEYQWNMKAPLKGSSPKTSSSAFPFLTRARLQKLTTETQETHWHIDHFGIEGRHVLQNVVISLPRATVLLLAGGNGTGKSTLLRALGDYQQPWSGVSSRISEAPHSGRLHFSPQPPKLVDELTAVENLRLMLNRGHPISRTDLSPALALLDWFGFSLKHLNTRAEALSGGEASILALTGALLSPADILLLDEPFESLSLSVIERALIAMQMVIVSTGKSIIASTHHGNVLDKARKTQVLVLSSEARRNERWVGEPLMQMVH